MGSLSPPSLSDGPVGADFVPLDWAVQVAKYFTGFLACRQFELARERTGFQTHYTHKRHKTNRAFSMSNEGALIAHLQTASLN